MTRTKNGTKNWMTGLALVSAAALAGCGTIMDGGTQKVDVVVRGSPAAHCEFTTGEYRNAGQFPGSVVLERAHKDLQADCYGTQNRHVTFIVPSRTTGKGTWGNTLFGILPGASYDAASGAMWGYPNPIIVDFREIGEGAKPEWPTANVDNQVDAARVGTAQIQTPKPVRMQPIMDSDLNPALTARETAPKVQTVDTVSLPIQNPQPAAAAPMAVTTVKTTTTTASGAKMKPVLSPEDSMGADPAKIKAQEAAKRKAKEDAARKAKADAEAKKRAALEAKAKAAKAKAEAQAAAKTPVQTLPETTETPPSASDAATTTTTTTTVTTDTATPTTPATSATPSVAPQDAVTSTTTTTTT
ncbi:MAG: hypothetical protein KDJ49_04540, partial [Alphaproteobacteria bacterium]|nr:hypothetical protein [Alphaproteobacteria bacterium]